MYMIETCRLDIQVGKQKRDTILYAFYCYNKIENSKNDELGMLF